MKAPTSTLVRRLVGSVRTATAWAVTRLASMSLASDSARVVLKRLSSSVAWRCSASVISELRVVSATSFSTVLRVRSATISFCDARAAAQARVHDPELRVDVRELLVERVDLRVRVATHLVHGLLREMVRRGGRLPARASP